MSAEGRQQWIDIGNRALLEGGVQAVRVEALARKIGVTKGSFYHHFSGRRALLEALLEDWRARSTDALITLADQQQEPWDRLEVLMRTIFMQDRPQTLEAPIRAWAQADESVRPIIEAIDARRVDYVASLLEASGMETQRARRRAILAYRVVIGDFIWQSAGGDPLSEEVLQEMLTLLASPP